MDCYFFSAHDMYPKDGVDSTLVTVAGNGDLALVKAELSKKRKSIKYDVNWSRTWTEVQEKWGYDKSWEWHGDTALIAAARHGHHDVVRLLLLRGADPTLIVDLCPWPLKYYRYVPDA